MCAWISARWILWVRAVVLCSLSYTIQPSNKYKIHRMEVLAELFRFDAGTAARVGMDTHYLKLKSFASLGLVK